MAATEREMVRRSRSGVGRPAPRPIQRPTRAPGGESVIEFQNVCKLYDGGDAGLDGASFSIERGEWVFIVGSTGSGKSTIMRLLIKELEPTSGSIVVAGRNLDDIDRKKVPSYRRNLGVVFQDFKLLPNR
ncbi:MAG TPA: ATP-binding cassette domain-containing protein, partial [Solirubrobacteraceae bacterium]|nr:ATP-binding cassette domain-containing protein [Solirubrobacteraceae bacterium]